MTLVTVYRHAFLILFVLLLAMRIYFLIKVYQVGSSRREHARSAQDSLR